MRNLAVVFFPLLACGGSDEPADPMVGPDIAGCTTLTASAVTASAAQSPNVAANVIDNNRSTRWSSEGAGQWVQVDFGAAKTLCGASVAWYQGNQRVNSFTLSVSSDGSAFTQVFAGSSNGTTTTSETYRFSPKATGRYLRLTFQGNTQNDWASVTELHASASGGSTPPPPPPDAGTGSGMDGGSGSTSWTCTQHVTTGTFASAFSAASGGSVLCLAPGSYGSFTGTPKSSPGVVITADTSAGGSASNVVFNSASFRGSSSWITMDTMTLGTAGNGALYVEGTPASLVFSNIAFKGFVDFENLQSSNHRNVVLDHCQLTWPKPSPSTCDGGTQPGLVFLGYDGAGHSGVTIENSLFANGDCDGVHTGVAVDVLDNEFANLCDLGLNHTDNIQFQGANGGRIAGNYVHEPTDGSCETQGITSYDGGTNGVVFEDNVVDIYRPWGIELYADENSIVRHNTIVYHPSSEFSGQVTGWISLDCKPSEFNCPSQAGFGTQVYDNIANITTGDGATAGRDDHNHNGADVHFVASTPASYADFHLAATSAGKSAADDGTDLGIR